MSGWGFIGFIGFTARFIITFEWISSEGNGIKMKKKKREKIDKKSGYLESGKNRARDYRISLTALIRPWCFETHDPVFRSTQITQRLWKVNIDSSLGQTS